LLGKNYFIYVRKIKIPDFKNFWGRSGFHDTFEEFIKAEKEWMDLDCTEESIIFEFNRLAKEFFINLHLCGGSLKNKQMLGILSVLQIEVFLQLQKYNEKKCQENESDTKE